MHKLRTSVQSCVCPQGTGIRKRDKKCLASLRQLCTGNGEEPNVYTRNIRVILALIDNAEIDLWSSGCKGFEF